MKLSKHIRFLTLAFIASGFIATIVASDTYAAAYTFPVLGKSSYQNDFNGARSSGKHNAIDIIAGKHQKIVSASDGTITFVAYPQPSYGYMVRVVSSGGYEYDYIHMNNDTPGTDNGKGGGMYAYAPGVREGNPVKKGQLLGYVGDSGNSEGTVSHLHFEVRKSGSPYNPYNSLNAASRITKPVPGPVLANEIVPYGEMKYTLNVAVGNVTGTSAPETIVGAGKTTGPKVKIYDSNKTELASFYPFAVRKYTDGIDVATGDLNGDGVHEIIVGGREADGSHIAAYSYTGGTVTKLVEFLVDGGIKTLARVTSGDIDGNGIDEIITGSGPARASRVKVYNLLGVKTADFKAFGTPFLGGIDVAAGDVIGDNKDEIVVSRLTSDSSLLRVYNGTGILQNEFTSYSGHEGGARISVGNVITNTAKDEIAVTATGGSPRLRTFNGTGSRLAERYVLEDWWRGYYDPAAATGVTKTATGANRRGSVQ